MISTFLAYGMPWVLILCPAVLPAQQAPFIHITGPDAPKGGTALFEDRNGGLWMAGDEAGAEGLTYFDGSRFLPVLKDRFPKVVVSGMAEDSDGGLWIASSGGLFRLSQGQLRKETEGAIESIVEAPSNVLLITADMPDSSQCALVRIAKVGNVWKQETIMKQPYRLRIQLSGDGEVMYPCPGGFCTSAWDELARWRPGQQPRITFHAGPDPQNSSRPSRVVKDRFGCFWMRSDQKVWYECPGEERHTLLPPGIAGLGPDAMAELADGSIVIPSFAEIAIGRPGKFRVIGALNGYPSVGGMLVRKDGTIWLGNANGLFVLSSRLQMEFWTERDGLSGTTWSTLPTGRKTFAVAGEQIRVLAPDRSRWLPLAELRLGSHLAAGPGQTFFATSHTEGVAQMTLDGRIVRRSAPVGVSMLARTPDGQRWAVGDDIARISIRGNRFDLQSANLPFHPGSGLDMKVDPAGGLWACTAAGLLHKDVSGWQVLSTQNGLRGANCLSFAIDREGGIWYGYSAAVSGFSWLQYPAGHARIRHFLDGGEVGTATSHFFGVDQRGWIWRGAVDGVYVADMEQARQGQWLHLDRGDGLPGVDTNQRSFVVDADGSVWFGVDNAVIHLSAPDDLVHPAYAPDLFVSGFSRNGASFQMAAMVDHIASGDDLTAHIGSLQYDRRSALRVRYRLLPGQTAWQETKALDLPLGVLSPGLYTLEVQGRIFTGPWSVRASRSFRVSPGGWAETTILLYGMCGLGLAGSLAWYWRVRRREDQALLPDLGPWRQNAFAPEMFGDGGQVLGGRFQLGEVLARGAFASVVAAFDLQEQRRCALKIFRIELEATASFAPGFSREVEALRQIGHPYVVSIYADGRTAAGAPYFAMEFIEGRTLRQALYGGALAPGRAARLLEQLAGALDAIHERRVFHRDIKPENIMLRNAGTEGEEAVLIDFSIAIIKSPDETLHGLSLAAGTFNYMAPEQALGHAQPASDIFSLAKVTIEMLAGKSVAALLPGAGLELAARIPDLLRDLDLRLSEESRHMLATALEFDPAKRPDVASQFAKPIVRDLKRP